MRARIALGAAVFPLVAIASCVLQQLLGALQQPAVGAVLAQASTPYFWRIALAAMHGLSAALIAAFASTAPRRWLARLPLLTAATVSLSVAASLGLAAGALR